MRNTLAAIMLLILAGCGPYMNGTDYLPTLEYTPVSSNSWGIFIPPKNTQRTKYDISYLPQFFPADDKNGLIWGGWFNYFYAKYANDSNAPLALWVRFPHVFGTWKTTGGDFWGNRVESAPTNNVELCNKKCFGVEISTNAVDMDFDTRGVFLMKDTEIIRGDLIALNKGFLCKDPGLLDK